MVEGLQGRKEIVPPAKADGATVVAPDRLAAGTGRPAARPAAPQLSICTWNGC